MYTRAYKLFHSITVKVYSSRKVDGISTLKEPEAR